MAGFTDSQISKWGQDYEKELCAKFDFLADRLSLEIISGTGEYELPNYVTNIRSVLYKGKELHAKGGRASIITGDLPFGTTLNAPYEYQVSGMGLRVIRLLPTPGDSIPVYTGAGGLWTVEADRDACIVEFYRTPHARVYDQTLMLPKWFRRYVLKDYICWKAFNSEGPQQDIKAAMYYEERRNANEGYCSDIKSAMYRSYHRVLSETKQIAKRKPGRPVLPSNFGYPTYGS